jgi:hypothetical protein
MFEGKGTRSGYCSRRNEKRGVRMTMNGCENSSGEEEVIRTFLVYPHMHEFTVHRIEVPRGSSTKM